MYERLLDGIESEKADIARSNRKIVFHHFDVSFLGRKGNMKDRKIIIPKQELSYLHEEYPNVTNKLFKRELIGDYQFSETLKWEDYPFTIPLLYKSNKVVSVEDAIYYYSMNLTGTTLNDTKKISPRLLDIIKGNELIREELKEYMTDQDLVNELNFLDIQNILQRIRDILYSKISLKEKKELITLFFQYIDEKYGSHQENDYYQQYVDSRKLLKFRMMLAERLYDEKYQRENTLEEINKILTK